MDGESRPLILAMKGHPGSGKSTVARAVASALRFPLLDKDDVRDPTFTVQLHLDAATSSASALLNDLSYAVLWRLAETQLRLGLSVIIDSPLSRRPHLNQLLSLASAVGARVLVIECRPTDEAEWRLRVEARGNSSAGEGWHKPATWEELRNLVEGYEGQSEYDIGSVSRLVLDTTGGDGTVEDMVGKVRDFVRSNCGIDG